MPRTSPRAPLAPLTANADNGRGRASADFPAEYTPLRGNDAAKRAMESLKTVTRSAEVRNLRGQSALRAKRKEESAAAAQTRENRARKATEELARVRLVELELLRAEVGEMRAREVAGEAGDRRKADEKAALADEVDGLRKEVLEMRLLVKDVKAELALVRREAGESAALAEERSVEIDGLRKKLAVAEIMRTAPREIVQVGGWEREAVEDDPEELVDCT